VRSRALPSWRAAPSPRAPGGGALTLLRF
jgi:hypothetical protein